MTPAEARRLLTAACLRLGYRPPGPRRLDLFVFGIRSPSDTVGLWDDAIGWTWIGDGGAPHLRIVRATTDPGRDGTAVRRDGFARMEPGQYGLCYEPGEHKGRPAMRQVAPMRYRRDAVADGRLDDLGPVFEAVIGTHIHDPHRAGLDTVRDASWGCQVPQGLVVDELRKLAARQAAVGMGSRVSYTLLDAGADPALLPLLAEAT